VLRTLLFLSPLILVVAPLATAQIDAPRVRVVDDLRLDATTEDFPTVSRIFVGPHGQIVVPIQIDQQLRIYDASGKKLATFGRKGSGPGEFNFISIVGWSADSIWVLDPRLRRTTYIGPDYKLLRSEMWPQVDLRTTEPGRVGAFDPLALLPDGSWIGQGFIATADGASRRGVLVRRSPAGEMKPVHLMPEYEKDPRMMWVAGFGRGVPFSLQPQYAWASNGSRFAELTAPMPASRTSHFTVTVFRATGDTVFSRRYQFDGEPIPKQAKDSALAAMLPRSGRVSEGPQDLPQRFQAIARERMSNWYIPAQSITLGLDQTIWIGLRPTEEGRKTLILNGRGDQIGTLLLPRTSVVRQATASRIWVTETDADGLTSVVRYRVQGLNCGAVRC
jgi:hypothetical protein